ncbi:MAG: aquaporin [Collinsella sp.]
MFAITTWSFGISVPAHLRRRVHEPRHGPLPGDRRCLIPWSSVVPFAIAEMLGGVAGACIAWLIYADNFRASEGEVDGVAIRNIFSTNPTPESYNLVRNFCIEAFDTFVFLTGILAIAAQAGDNHLALGIGVACSSGPWAWARGDRFAMNQARDLGPRICLPAAAHSQQGGQQLALRPGGALHRPRSSAPSPPRCSPLPFWHRVLTEALPYP